MRQQQHKHHISETARMTIDFPTNEHKKLKILAAMKGMSMRDLVVYFVHTGMKVANIPNKETLAVMQDTDEGKNLVKYNNIEELFEDLGLA